MRGVEAAFAAWYEVEKGRFASEALRQILTEVAPAERRLAASLLYGALRRQSLWKDLIRNRCRRPFHQLAPVTRAALILGTAGLVELRHFVPAVLMTITTFATLIISIQKNLAPAGSGQLIAQGQGPLTFAAALLLVLAVGVIFVSARKFIAGHRATA